MELRLSHKIAQLIKAEVHKTKTESQDFTTDRGREAKN
jgi:hypothetical protein